MALGRRWREASGRYLSFGPVLPPGNVFLQVFYLEVMRKLQQLLFLGPVEGRWGGQEGGGTGVLQVGWESRSGSLLQAQVFWEVGAEGTQRPSEQEGIVARASAAGQGSYLTVHNGLFLLQLHLLLSSLSTQQSLKDWPFREATLLLQGRLAIWGQSTGKGVSVEEAVAKVPRLRGEGQTWSFQQGQALPHAANGGHKDSTQALERMPIPWGDTVTTSALLDKEDRTRPQYTGNPQEQYGPS